MVDRFVLEHTKLKSSLVDINYLYQKVLWLILIISGSSLDYLSFKKGKKSKQVSYAVVSAVVLEYLAFVAV